MKIVVLIKQTFDTEAVIALDGKGAIIDTGIKKIMNPYDEFAVEEAIRIKEAQGGEITLVSLGTDTAVDALKLALAMGCDKAILLNDAAFQGGDEYSAAQALAAAIRPLEYDLILAGWVAIDDNSGQTAVRVAEILNIPQVTMVTKLSLNNGTAAGEREIEGAVMTVEAPLPALITVQKGINEPRYPGMKGIMAAKKKEVKKVSAADLSLTSTAVGQGAAKTIVKERFLPPKRQSCTIIQAENPADAAGQLVRLLHEEAKVI